MWYNNDSYVIKLIDMAVFQSKFIFLPCSLNDIPVGDDKGSVETYEEPDNDHLDGLMLAHKQGNQGLF